MEMPATKGLYRYPQDHNYAKSMPTDRLLFGISFLGRVFVDLRAAKNRGILNSYHSKATEDSTVLARAA